MKKLCELIGAAFAVFCLFFAVSFAIPVGFAAGNMMANKAFGEYTKIKTETECNVNNRYINGSSTTYVSVRENKATK